MGNPRPAESGRGLFALFDRLTGRLPLRLDTRSFPVTVLEPAGDGDDADRHLDELRRAANEKGLSVISPELTGTDGESAALDLVRTVSQPLTWSQTKSQYGRRRFPRSELIETIQAAAADTDGAPGRPPYQGSALAAVARWKKGARPVPRLTGALFTSAWLSTLFIVIVGGLAQQTRPRYLIIAGACLVSVFLLSLALNRFWLPVLSKVGRGSRYRWFARTSFFAVLGDGDDGDDDLGFEGRLYRVFERLTKPDAARFLLQIKTFALLEDIRDQYRKATPSGRGFKRTTPPVVFLSRAGRDNGGLALLSAMSDIRARRSEFHPLLVIASIDAATRDELGPADPGDSPEERYEQWRSSLGTDQGPSESVPLPWLLRIPVAGDPAADRADAPAAAALHRPYWTWLWSWTALGAVLALSAVTLAVVHQQLNSTYCSVGFPLSWNADTHQQTNDDGSRECVGVSTHGVRFEVGRDSMGLDGDQHRPSEHNTGARLTLADLQRRIADENAAVLGSGDPYVTIVYVGTFTASPGQNALTVSSIHELAGAYLAQQRNNAPGHSKSLKLRLLPANTGQNMVFSNDTADRILDLAHRDPTLVGVVGFGRNTEYSKAAITRLNDAGLPIVNTVNSSDVLPRLAHYYGLASTDHDEAAAARAAVRAELKGRPVDRAMIVHRTRGPSRDLYSREIADDVTRVLKPRATDRVEYTGTDEIARKVRAACEAASYTLVYFAGRAEDLRGLRDGLTEGGCTGRRLVLLAGDDITKIRFGAGLHDVPLPDRTVVYHTAFVHLPFLIAGHRDQTNEFFQLARNRLGIGVPRVRPDDPLLVDGQMALAYDAAVAVGEAADRAYGALGITRDASGLVPGSRTVTSGAVLLELRGLNLREGVGATGAIDFSRDDHTVNGPGNRGLTMIKVTMEDGEPVSTPICGRLNGGVAVPGLPACPR
ncbi:hypothetical protein [Actinomadura sp. 9N215]|uniref:hypothetical protein n=1 Tax=Actinomadura sp. 9N215 TaxID=3375150 RepID=UPI0037A8AA71